MAATNFTSTLLIQMRQDAYVHLDEAIVTTTPQLFPHRNEKRGGHGHTPQGNPTIFHKKTSCLVLEGSGLTMVASTSFPSKQATTIFTSFHHERRKEVAMVTSTLCPFPDKSSIPFHVEAVKYKTPHPLLFQRPFPDKSSTPRIRDVLEVDPVVRKPHSKCSSRPVIGRCPAKA